MGTCNVCVQPPGGSAEVKTKAEKDCARSATTARVIMYFKAIMPKLVVACMAVMIEARVVRSVVLARTVTQLAVSNTTTARGVKKGRL
jgi:hypothetical protein